MLPIILGLAGETLSDVEKSFFEEAAPAGFILFSRNVRDRAQLRRLTDSLRDLSGRSDVPILVDQEGGRIARLGPPQWPVFPAPWRFAQLYRKAPISAIEATRLNAQAIALVLADAGINVNCAPSLDLRHEGAHDVIGDRSFGEDAMQVAALGRAFLDGMEAAGVCGIVKHVPGHGRAVADSHRELPRVEADAETLECDLAPFRSLRSAPMAMTAHILFPAWDRERCATLSPIVISEIIRGVIGFEGLLISDDIGMSALTGPVGDRAVAALAAGCDLALHGSGRFEENVRIAEAVAEMGTVAKARLDKALARVAGKACAEDAAQLAQKRDALLAHAQA